MAGCADFKLRVSMRHRRCKLRLAWKYQSRTPIYCHRQCSRSL